MPYAQAMDVTKQEESLVSFPYTAQVISDFLIHRTSQFRLGILLQRDK